MMRNWLGVTRLGVALCGLAVLPIHAQGTATAPAGAAPQGARPSQTVAAPPPLPHPATEAQVQELLNLTDASKRFHEELNQRLTATRQRMPPYIPASVWDEAGTKLTALDLAKISLPQYQAYVSESEMNSVLAFYRTDAGKHYSSVQGELAMGVQTTVASQVQGIFQSIFLAHRTEIETAKKNYDAQHTGPASK